MRSKMPSCRSIVSKHFLPPFACLTLLAAATAASFGAATVAPSPAAETSIAQRAPGLHRQPLALPVPRTFALTHVEPAVYSKALGNDPQRIFEFVRDQIAYESYEGCLRGARGTLLAMAGNSVDRAVLLTSMLQAAGQQVRYACGKLSEADARELIKSISADRQSAKASEKTSPTKSEAIAFVPEAIERDFKMVRALVPNPSAPSDGPPALAALAKETTTHYWVQWEQEGKWIDLDPSFADSTPGKALTASDKTLQTLPKELFHEIAIRV